MCALLSPRPFLGQILCIRFLRSHVVWSGSTLGPAERLVCFIVSAHSSALTVPVRLFHWLFHGLSGQASVGLRVCTALLWLLTITFHTTLFIDLWTHISLGEDNNFHCQYVILWSNCFTHYGAFLSYVSKFENFRPEVRPFRSQYFL